MSRLPTNPKIVVKRCKREAGEEAHGETFVDRLGYRSLDMDVTIYEALDTGAAFLLTPADAGVRMPVFVQNPLCALVGVEALPKAA